MAKSQLFVATAEQEISCHSDKGCGAETNSRHFIRTNVVVVMVITVMIITVMISKGAERSSKSQQNKV